MIYPKNASGLMLKVICIAALALLLGGCSRTKNPPGKGSQTALRDRCTTTHQARLKECDSVSDELKAQCKRDEGVLLNICATLSTSLDRCDGLCALKQCGTTPCAIPGGTGLCLGNICAPPEGDNCGYPDDKCKCKTTVYPPDITHQDTYCDCHCQK